MKIIINILMLQTLLSSYFAQVQSQECPSLCQCDAGSKVTCTSITKTSDLINIAAQISNDTEELILKGNNLTKFDVPFNLTALTTLDLSDNLFGSFPTGLGDMFPNLEVLKLNNIKLDQLSTDTFTGLEKLIKITLDHNNLRSLDDDVFQTVINLRQLLIKSNQISTISKDAFKGLSNLVNLDLSFNQISELKPGILDNFSDKALSIAIPKNKLKLLPNGLFRKLKEIKMLDVSFNQISRIDDDVFNGVTMKDLLGLQGNNLKKLPVESLLNSSIGRIIVMDNPINCVCDFMKLFPKFSNAIYGECIDGNTTLDFHQTLSTYNKDSLAKALCTLCELNNTCLNGGKCIPIRKTDLICECSAGFYGSSCQHQPFCLSSSPCKHGGTCANKNNSDYQCFCKEDYYGKNCELVHEQTGLSEASIVGIVLGVIFLIIVVIIIIIFSKKRCQHQQKDSQNAGELTSLKQKNPDA